MRFEGKVAIVTGGGQGIGETYAKSFAAEGACVVIAELNKEGGERVANEITEAGQPAVFVETDVSSEQDAAAAVAAAQDQFGGVDILVNNAAIFHGMRYETLLDVDMDYYYQIMKVNMHSPLVMTRAVAASMVQRGGGSVINQSSTAAWKAQGGYYGVAKLGVQGLTMCLASELGDRNIRVNAIAPGPTDTEATRQVPAEILDHVVNGLALKRLGETVDVVNLAKFLASDEAGWITGQTFRVDGGDTLLPA
ncbi:MAG: SDR family oxidoreductase [Luminiphilus sp.]|nr:short-chain dehydrogenase [Halieaceae bacterium]MDG1216424.1 SDR family oxidoreductase [Luminiphilus sp.]RZO79653.1 MAG: SDR family oxidoreductase [Halieaceae bacterium]|tara:strand:- start:446 stop:1198 length:753 start_codon:yes stop_codon:yes gene_type:complete